MIIRAEGISKNYIRNQGDTNIFTAVKPTDFALEQGEMVVISGRSGSGKSTFMSMLSGLLEPTEGRVFLEGNDHDGPEAKEMLEPLDASESMKRTDLYSLTDDELSALRNGLFGYIPQEQSPIASLTVLENVLLPTRFGDNKGSMVESMEKGEELLTQLDIANLRDVMPAELSGGELRRVAIARALLLNPGFIFADEPTGDLDDENTTRVLKLLRNRADQGAAVLLVTHESDAFQYGDKVMKMSGGLLE